ncbi:hypothetical protein CM240_1140 [Clostridium bornimense]|uniref:Uncharacterized protein n=1 Tax=Clostridium bornimense TaxID=1216932 RepID=W6RXE6_9CLOT|nr:hypothetical protein [Clostridium bornimense]CDM68304.1 hypothetical protein CM240_1140 [Clostridium bornimense]
MAIGYNYMGRIEINYSECGNLAKNLEFVLDNISREKNSINNAIYKLNTLKDKNSDIRLLNQCLEDKIVNLSSEEEKVRNFIIDFKKYIQEISDTDDELANEIRKESKLYINNVIDINKLNTDKLLNVEESNENIIAKDSNITQGIDGMLYLFKGDEDSALRSLTSIMPFMGLMSNGNHSISKCDKAADILNSVDENEIYEKEMSKLNLYKENAKITREINSMIREGDIENLKNRISKVVDIGEEYVLKTLEGINILCDKKECELDLTKEL